jgi:subtilisin family serine protease
MGPDLWEMFEDGKADDEVAAIIRLGHYGTLPKNVRVVTQFGEIITVRMTRADVLNVSGAPEVASMVAGDSYLGPDVETELSGMAELSSDTMLLTDQRRPKDVGATGQGVVVGVVDWGFDFAHPDFRKPDGTTRILALWDQRGSRRPGSPQPFGYRIVHDRQAINRALQTDDPYAALGYHPADADTGFGCHGTHVVSIAAGGGAGDRPSGIAPEADIVVVHNAPWDEAEPSRLGDSVTLLEGIDFITRTAGERPWVINLSMGRHSGFHNGQELVEQGFDAAVRSAPGRAICLSAGNYFSKHIHASGQLRPTQERTLIWEIKEGHPTNNQLEFWYSWQDKMELAVRSPDGSLQTRVKIGERTKLVSGGREVGNVYHRSQDPISLNNHISVFLYTEAPPGPWELTLVGTDVIDGRYHAWIERDVSCARCQSRFRPEDADPRSTTGTICNGRRTFAVGAYNSHEAEPQLGSFSSCGPTIDGRLKPDLCAPGVAVLAARSAIRDKKNPAPLLTRMSGTSMASPHVAGTIALMFQVAPRRLRIEETHNLLLESAEKVSIPDELPDRIGIGFLDISAVVEAARDIGRPSSFKETTVQATTTKANPIGKKPEEKSVTEGTEREVEEAIEMATCPCGCQHSDLSSEAQERQGDSTEAVSRFELAEDAPKTFDPDAPPKEIAEALAAKNWALALSLAIKAGVRDENKLTNFIFFAKHQELPHERLDTKDPKYKQLSTEWGNILNHEIWKAIQAASKNTALVVSGAEVADHDRFFWGTSGKKLKRLVEDAAKEVGLNPGLLGTIIMAETRRPQSYLSSEKVSSYHIGVDDFYEMRGSIAAKVPTYAKVKWDRKQVPRVHLNDAKKNPREVKTIDFNSGPDGVLATAVYLKYREVNLREIATKLGGDFDSLPVETRFALTRMVMAAGEGGATPYLKDALAGKDIFVRKNVAVEIYQTQRNATVRTAQAMHLSEWVFGINLGATEAETEETGDQEETEEGLRQKLTNLSLLPHFSEVNGKDVQLVPAGMDPGIYDGPDKFKIAPKLQECLNAAVDNHKFRHIRVALVDLTKDVTKPEFAGFHHEQQVFAASVPKIAAMLAAFQLRHDLEAAHKNKSAKTQDDLFLSVRDDWAATQNDPKGTATPFADGITVRGKLVLWKGKKIELGADLPKSPRLESIFPDKSFPAIKFSSTGETKDELKKLIKDFDSASGEVSSLNDKAKSKDEKVKAEALKHLGKAQAQLKKATHNLESLGFEERLRVAMGGLVPASNFIVSTIVRDVGFPYIASTLLQSGLYDPNRDGGMW